MKSCLMLNWLKFHNIIHNTTASTHQVTLHVLKKNDILGLYDLLRAVNSLQVPTLARQIWRHNDVVGRNEYLIYTFSESTFPWVYLLQFLFKSTYHSWRYERKCELVFFFWTQCMLIMVCCHLSDVKLGTVTSWSLLFTVVAAGGMWSH